MIGAVGASPTHHDEMEAALELERRAQRAALGGEWDRARRLFAEAASHYRASWKLASRTSYGRLVGLMKAAILAGAGEEEAAFARAEMEGADEHSATAAYVRALAATIGGDDAEALRWAAVMHESAGAFARTSAALEAVAKGDAEAYRGALAEIVRDFEERPQHLTGVPFADTALMLECLAGRRGLCAGLSSPLLPEPPR